VDFDVLGPLLKVRHHLLLGFHTFLFEPAFLDGQLGGAVFAPAQVGDVAAHLMQNAQFLLEFIGHFAVPAVEEGGVAGGQHGGQAVGEAAVEDLLQFAGLEFADLVEPFAPGPPFGKAAVAPFGEVLFADGNAVELRLEHGAHFRAGVEPVEEGAAGFVVVEAAVEFRADLGGEAGDFSSAMGIHKFFNFILTRGRQNARF